ncbi:MAG TPA: autotransporter-associated beta strand repeat-containing protein, partial [Candidatus Polarisedimenticolia bacterium]|nr:autotransporter-associated beta strand repeat-containing protein [Candidatus Polarisedimenticolia bacterium]
MVKALVAASALLFPVVRARATGLTWTGAINGNWSEPGNWNPARAPQNGDLLYFWDDNVSHTTMVNDIPNLSCAIAFSNTSHNFVLSGNTLYLSSLDATPGTSSLTGYDQTVTIDCQLVFPTGGTMDVGPAAAADLGENKETLYLNGGIQVQSGALSIHAEGNSGLSGHVYIAGALSGAGDIQAHVDETDGSTKGSIEFDTASNSSLTGTLWLSTDGDSTIDFNQSPGITVAGLVGVHNGATVNLNVEQTDQSGTTLEVASGGRLSLSGGNATFFRVIMQNGSTDSQSSLLNTGSHLLGLNNGIVASCDSDSHAPVIQGRLNLIGFETIDADGTAAIGLDLPADIEGNGFQKTGGSTLILEGTNTFTGTAEVDEGSLDVRNSNALGSTSVDTILNGGSLTLRASISSARLVARSESTDGDAGDLPGASLIVLSSSPVTWGGPIFLETNLDVFGDDVIFSNEIAGFPGRDSLGLFNVGTVEITGSLANSQDKTLVRCPLLELNQLVGSQSVGAFGNTLEVGGGTGGPCEVRWLNCCQSGSGGQNLILHANGVANLAGFSDDIANVTFNGGKLDTGGGLLTIGGQVTANPNDSTAFIQGNIEFRTSGDFALPVTVDFDVGLGNAAPGLQVNAVISAGGIYKTGPGTLNLTAANTFDGVTAADGNVLINNATALGTGSTTVNTNATLQ